MYAKHIQTTICNNKWDLHTKHWGTNQIVWESHTKQRVRRVVETSFWEYSRNGTVSLNPHQEVSLMFHEGSVRRTIQSSIKDACKYPIEREDIKDTNTIFWHFPLLVTLDKGVNRFIRDIHSSLWPTNLSRKLKNNARFDYLFWFVFLFSLFIIKFVHFGCLVVNLIILSRYQHGYYYFCLLACSV